MPSSIFAKLKNHKRKIGLLAKSLFLLFWAFAAIEVYSRFIAKSQAEPMFLFFSLFGGLFAVLFYLCIVYFSVLGIARFNPPSTVNSSARYWAQAKQIGCLVMALLFTYAALATVAKNLTS